MYKRSQYQTIKKRLEEPRRFIQVVMGPRQVGKSTVVKQVLDDIRIPYRFFSADNVPASDTLWISQCWESVRTSMQIGNHDDMILVIDEIQKIKRWSEAVKAEWDKDTFHNTNIKVLLLGSSRVMLEKGLAESLAGRFEEIRMSGWSFVEMRDCFGYTLDQYMYFGGYPGAASLIDDFDRYQQYMMSAIVDATINKDILMESPVNKPALLRQTFELASAYSGNILSYTKMIGQLQDAGNTTTLANYLNLLNQACMVDGLSKFSNDRARRRGSIPKFQVYDNSLKNLYMPYTFETAKNNPKVWGHIFESAIGSYLLSQSFIHRFEVCYWREGHDEVDFVVHKNGVIIALEIKSNDTKHTSGLTKFVEHFHPDKAIIVGSGGITAEEFLQLDFNSLLKK